MSTPKEVLETLQPGNRSFSIHFDLDHLDLTYRMNTTTGNFWQLKAGQDLVRAIMDVLGYEVLKKNDLTQSFPLRKKP